MFLDTLLTVINALLKLTVVTAKQPTSVNLNGSLKSRSDKHKGSVRNCDCAKNESAKHC